MLPLCSYHPSEPEFPPIQFKNSSLPVGEFPCCGETALRFQPIAQVRPTHFGVNCVGSKMRLPFNP